MDHLKEREEALITTINHLEDQENWAKAHGHQDLARAPCYPKAYEGGGIMKYQVTTVSYRALRWCIHSHKILWVL